MVRLKQIKNDRIEKYQILRKRQFTKVVYILTTQKLDYTKKIYLYEAQISYYPQTYLEIVLQLMD